MDSDPVPPSSPPHATAADPQDSPFFEPHQYAFTPKSSSPPPLFSSDDSRESADIANYESPRIFKNKRKGRWWENGDTSNLGHGEYKKAKFTRNYDSGVYMMSDATDSSESLPLQHHSPFGLYESQPSHVDTIPQATFTMTATSQEEQVFYTTMRAGLEQNSDTFDFSSSNLQDHHIQRIGELASVIKGVPDPGEELPVEGQYRSLLPELYVCLKDNKLQHLTPSLFNVAGIISLNLSNNDISELPAEIRQLCNLLELHVTNTKLRWLPFEFLGLYRGDEGDNALELLGDSGVPWLEPKVLQEWYPEHLAEIYAIDHTNVQRLQEAVDAHPDREKLLWTMRDFELARIWEGAGSTGPGVFPHHPKINYCDGTKYLSRTPVSYFDKVGRLLKGSPTPPSSNSDDFAVMTETDRGVHGVPLAIFAPPAAEMAHTNSLVTMAVHCALRQKDLDDLSIPDLRSWVASPVRNEGTALLDEAESNERAGFGTFRKCHACKREYVIVRAEWIEWWYARIGKALPYKVKVCSWACVPDEMRGRPAKILEWE